MKKSYLNSAHYLPSFAVLLILAVAAAGPVVAQTENKVLAVVDGREIRQQEVDALLIAQVMPLEQQLYAIRKATLDNLILTSLLEAEAHKRGLSIEELRKLLMVGKVEVKSIEVENAYAENLSAFAAMSPDEAKERVRLDLENQARITRYREAVRLLREKAEVEFLLREPRFPDLANAEGLPSLGAKNGTLTIVEFADFQCPYCRESQNAIKQVLEAYGDEVTLVFKHLPLDIHSEAHASARAAFCAGEQGLFWKYHDALFAQQKLSTATFTTIALSLGLIGDKFKACLDSDAANNAVLRDIRDAARWGINSTPTFILNGRIVRGAVDFETFKTLIEQEKSARTTSRSNEPGRTRQ